MSERVWNKGAPPHVGWWNARCNGTNHTCMWGWWDGNGWSVFTEDCFDAGTAGDRALENGAIYDGPGVEWSDYYPENARVPRINPETSMSKNLKTQWRVQTKSIKTGNWKNRGLFETRAAARRSATLYRECMVWESGRFVDPFGFGNTRIIKYVKGQK